MTDWRKQLDDTRRLWMADPVKRKLLTGGFAATTPQKSRAINAQWKAQQQAAKDVATERVRMQLMLGTSIMDMRQAVVRATESTEAFAKAAKALLTRHAQRVAHRLLLQDKRRARGMRKAKWMRRCYR